MNDHIQLKIIIKSCLNNYLSYNNHTYQKGINEMNNLNQQIINHRKFGEASFELKYIIMDDFCATF